MDRWPASESNRLLASLPPEAYDQIRPRLELVSLAQMQVLYDPGDSMEYVYFPVSGLCSEVVMLASGEALEANIIGREGLVGARVILGKKEAFNQSVIQVAGQAMRLRTELLLGLAEQSPAVHRRLLALILALWNQTTLAALCNRRHSVEERFARWLLTAQDRTGSDNLPLTHQFLALMLGVRRVSVTTTGAVLQRAGYIRLLRGRIQIVDRAGLEEACCECYALMRREVERVYI